jgi:hypothetical protein
MIIYNQNLWFVDIQFAHARAQSDAIALEYETDKLCLIPQGCKDWQKLAGQRLQPKPPYMS